MKNPLVRCLFLLSIVFGNAALAAPKYGPNAVPLSKETNLEYFKKNPAPDFWALMPYYTAQQLGQQCSAASFVMVLNGARRRQELSSQDQLVTIQNLLEKYTDDRYREFMTTKFNIASIVNWKAHHGNVGNKRLAEVLTTAVEKLGIKNPKTRVDLILIDPKNLEASRRKFHEMLVENEKSSDDFIVLSGFVQGMLTGDPEGHAHVAPVGAYDEKHKLVLILDPDRAWYEPYWSPEDKVFDAIANPESDNEAPGYIHFQVR